MNTAVKDGKYAKMARAVFTTGAAYIINYLIQLVLTPYITRTVGTEAYGFVALAKNFAQYAAIITAVLNSFAARYIAVSYHEDNMKEANTFYSSVFWGDIVLGTGLLLVSLVLIHFLDLFLHISPVLLTDVKRLFFYVFLNFWLVTLGCAFESAAYIKNKLDLLGLIKALSYITEALILYLFFTYLPPSIGYVGAGLIAASVVMVLGNFLISKKATPELTIQLRWFSWRAVKKLVIDGVWTSLNSLGNILNNGLDLIVCNLMLSQLRMGQVAVAKTVHTMLTGVFVILNPSFQPMLLKSYAANDRDTLLSELKTAMKLSGMAGSVVFAVFSALGLRYFELWIPDQDVHLIYALTVLNCLTLVSSGCTQPLYFVYILTLKRKIPCLITLAGGVLNVLGMYVLIRFTSLDVYAVILTSVGVAFIMDFITNPLYMAHVLSFPRGIFFPIIARNVLAACLLSALFHFLAKLYTPGGWVSLAVCIMVFALIGAVLYAAVVCDGEDRRKLSDLCRRALKRA